MTYVRWQVVGGLAVADSSGVRPVTLLGVVAEVRLQREAGEDEQRREQRTRVQRV